MADRPPHDRQEFEDLLRSHGAVFERENGGHRQWKLPNGRTFTVPTAKRDWSHRPTLYHRARDLRKALAGNTQSYGGR